MPSSATTRSIRTTRRASRISAGCSRSSAPISRACTRSPSRCGACSSVPGERLLIGEIYLPVERLVAYYGPDLTEIHLPFNFNLMWAKWRPATIVQLIQQYEAVLPAGGWPSWVLGNHDQARVATRFGPAQARVAMVLL